MSEEAEFTVDQPWEMVYGAPGIGREGSMVYAFFPVHRSDPPDEAAPQRQLLPLTAEAPERTEPPVAVPPRPQGEQDLE